jgi:adenosine deaminase
VSKVPLAPLADVPVPQWVAALPKADLHLHQEERPRLERVVARREGRLPFDWRSAARGVLALPPGMPRLNGLFEQDARLDLGRAVSDSPEEVIAKIVEVLDEAADDGAWLVEIRCGPSPGGILRPDFMTLFREAERRVQARYPRLRAEAIGFLLLGPDHEPGDPWDRALAACLRLAREGLGGVDFRVDPYDTPADPALWALAADWSARAADAGLGVTVHAGEFSTANLDAALRLPGLRRIGHGVYLAADPRLLELAARAGVTIECCPSCNVILGAVPSYEAHPLRDLIATGLPVTLNTDNPIRVCTSIGREYAVAAALGLSQGELLACTRHAFAASFGTVERREQLLAALDAWQDNASQG